MIVMNADKLDNGNSYFDSNTTRTPTSVWSSIESTLADDIANGRLAPGSKLDGEHRLAERFGVNRHTVRQAIGQLAAKGLVHVRHGLGTFVADVAVDYVLGRRTRFTENLTAAGFRGAHRFLESATIKASEAIANGLAIRTGTQVHLVVALGEANGRPITLAEHYFPARRFKDLPARFIKLASVSSVLATYGVADFTRSRSVVSARLPGHRVADALQQSARRPVLFVEGINVDLDGTPVEFGRTWFAGDLVQLIIAPDN
jgi:GntR family transcriptional regulator, phosphonate transport system regulatory protein